MVLKQMGASVCVWEVHNDQERSDTKSETQLKGAQLQLASRKQGRILGIWDIGTRADPKISMTGPKKSEGISSLFLALALSPLSCLIVLA